MKKPTYTKVGFKTALELLSEKGKPMPLTNFYRLFNNLLYYNAFLRIKDYMITHNLITIYSDKNGIKIAITTKGINTLKKLNELDDYIERGL